MRGLSAFILAGIGFGQDMEFGREMGTMQEILDELPRGAIYEDFIELEESDGEGIIGDIEDVHAMNEFVMGGEFTPWHMRNMRLRARTLASRAHDSSVEDEDNARPVEVQEPEASRQHDAFIADQAPGENIFAALLENEV